MIKKFISIKHLSIPNVETIFYGTSNIIYFNKIINCNIVVNAQLSMNKYFIDSKYQVSKLFDNIKNEAKKYPQFITDESTHNYLKLC